MKNDLKENKGITLIALIITIIVLLILAIVTISGVNEGKIFAHANNAATKWNAAATEENGIISNYLIEMGKHDKSDENDEKAINSEWWGNHGLTSSYVNYDKEYTADSSNYSYNEDKGASVEFFTEGGLKFIHGEDDSNISLETFNEYSGAWGAYFNSNDNWFSFFDKEDGCYYTLYFTKDNLSIYVSDTIATTENINTIISGTLAGTLTV